MTDAETIEKLCDDFLGAVRSSAPREAQDAALAALTPFVRERVQRYCRTHQNMFPDNVQPEDVLQDVLIKLMSSPPSRTPQKSALFTLIAWLQKTTFNRVDDLRRKETTRGRDQGQIRRKQPLESLEQLSPTSMDRGNPLVQRLEARDELEHYIDYLQNTYPKGALLVETRRNNPDATPAELAEIMDISIDNYYQITSRTKNLLSDYERNRRRKGEKG